MTDCQTNKEQPNTNRRMVLKGMGAAVAAAFVADTVAAPTSAKAAEGVKHSHAHHGHTVDTARQRLVDHALDCVKKGEACSAHCLILFKQGDNSVADCARSVQEMLAACNALARLATYDSRHLNAMAKVCIGICEDCEKECKKHSDKHAECKACADSCADCIRVCKEYIA